MSRVAKKLRLLPKNTDMLSVPNREVSIIIARIMAIINYPSGMNLAATVASIFAQKFAFCTTLIDRSF